MAGMDKQKKWDQRFLDLSDHIAGWSQDRDHKVGAVIVGPDLEIRSTGYNGLPRGVKSDDPARFDRETGEKFLWVEHAERNAIYNAGRIGVALAGCSIYINRFPCADCARAIIQSGISRVCCPQQPTNDGALDHSFDVSQVLIRESGTRLITLP
jgi:dCMP deaminase